MNNTDQWIKDLELIKSRLEYRSKLLQNEVSLMALDLTALTADVEATVSAEASAVALINAIVAELKVSANDPAAIQALATRLEVGTAPLAAAVAENPLPVANTP